MIPIHELLSKIKYDKEFGKAEFTIGYYDRKIDKIINVDYLNSDFDTSKGILIIFKDEYGQRKSIPFHRIKKVYKNEELIWERVN